MSYRIRRILDGNNMTQEQIEDFLGEWHRDYQDRIANFIVKTINERNSK